MKHKSSIDEAQTVEISKVKTQLKDSDNQFFKHSQEIEGLQDNVVEKDRVDAKQSSVIESLKKDSSTKAKTDKSQSVAIASLEDKLQKMEAILHELDGKIHRKNYIPHFFVCLVMALASLGLSGYMIIR